VEIGSSDSLPSSFFTYTKSENLTFFPIFFSDYALSCSNYRDVELYRSVYFPIIKSKLSNPKSVVSVFILI
jgi:hypothetical protein